MATKFKDFMQEIEDEARAEGPEAVADLEALNANFRLGRHLAEARRSTSSTLSRLSSGCRSS